MWTVEGSLISEPLTSHIKSPVVCQVDKPLLLADEAALGNILQSSNSPAHLLCPVELKANPEGKKEEIMRVHIVVAKACNLIDRKCAHL